MSYLPRSFHVEAFGAKGDGSTDDSSSIASGLLAATGSILQFRPGRIYIMSSPQSVPNYTHLYGPGATIKADTDANFQFFQLYGKTGCQIEGLTFDGSWTGLASQNNAMVDVSTAADITISDCTFKDVSSECIRLLGGSTRVNITDNRFTNFNVAVFADDDGVAAPTRVTIARNHMYAGNSTAAGSAGIKLAGLAANGIYSRAGIVVVDNTITNAGEMGVEMQTWYNDSVVANNTIEQTTHGISIDQCARVAINGNVVKGCSYIGIEATNCAETTINGCTVDGTTGAGVTATDEGVLINVSSGCCLVGTSVYGASNRNVYVLDSNRVTIAGNTVKVAAASSNGVLIKNTSDVNINGNMLWSTSSAMQDMIVAESNNATVARMSICNNSFVGDVGRFGIFLAATTNPIEDVVIANNNTAGMYAAGLGVGLYYAQNDAGGVCQRIRLFDNIGSGDQTFTNCINVPVWSGAANVILSEKYETVLIDATAAARVVTLPRAEYNYAKPYTVVKFDSSANPVQIVSTGSQLINTLTGQFLTAAKARMSIVSDGVNWTITQSGAP